MPFPTDEYTPHGYLDTPTHTRNASPRGVLRSHDIGFRWHYPAHAGMYGGRRETYRAGFRIAVDGALALHQYARVISPYHSKNLMAFDFAVGSARGRVEFVLVGEHTLAAQIEVRGAAQIDVLISYERIVSANGEWGESGLVGRRVGENLVLQSFEDGDAFVFGASHTPAAYTVSATATDAERWCGVHAPMIAPEQFVTVVGRRGDLRALHAVAQFRPAPAGIVDLLLARGPTLRHAEHRLETARRTLDLEIRHKRDDDTRFWRGAPRLSGDWPAHWRRGLVYDLETLRMMVRQPVGIYRHIWDAMQIQAPRVVLAEAAMDALALAYADPARAQQLLLGTLRDAPDPSVPCTREDGTYNMVAADGTVCGTAPAWGYPLLVAATLAALRPDAAWLRQIYPLLVAHLEWWRTNRSAADGGVFYACSWESGQDDSPRFGAQPLGGGHPVRHVRPVDLLASLAHGYGVLAQFAQTLGLPHDVSRWQAQADTYARQLDDQWHETRYADLDTGTGTFSDVDDPMLLAPAALGVADPARTEALRASIAQIAAESLTWPPPSWTVIAAASELGMHTEAATLAAAICERVYGFWDARRPADGQTLPGIACEFWPLDGRCGGEGYGWGAFTVHLVLRYIVGFAPTATGYGVRPLFPPAWRVAGRSYGVAVRVAGRLRRITVAVVDEQYADVSSDDTTTRAAWGDLVSIP